MTRPVPLLLASAASFALAGPAWAQGAASIPEPGGLTLLALGIAGVLIGRIAATKRPRD